MGTIEVEVTPVVEVGATVELDELADWIVVTVGLAASFFGLPQSVCAAALRPPGPLDFGWDLTYSP